MNGRRAMAYSSAALCVVGSVLAVFGFSAAISLGLWLQAAVIAALFAAALARAADPHWSAVLAVAAASYARMPIRLFVGLELPPIEPFVALPLWFELLADRDRPSRIAHVGAAATLAFAAAAPWLGRAHWVGTVPAAVVALALVSLRDLRLGRYGAPALCGLTFAAPLAHLVLELWSPWYPAASLAPAVNLWIASCATIVTVWTLREDRSWSDLQTGI